MIHVCHAHKYLILIVFKKDLDLLVLSHNYLNETMFLNTFTVYV